MVKARKARKAIRVQGLLLTQEELLARMSMPATVDDALDEVGDFFCSVRVKG